MNPVLVAVFPPSDGRRAGDAAAALVSDLERALPDVAVLPTWLDRTPGGLHEVVARLTRPAVVVPAFPVCSGAALAQLTEAAEVAGARVDVSPPLGPDRLLARATVVKLRAAGACWGDAVVLVAPPSACDSLAVRDTERAAELLACEWGPRVSVAVCGADCDLPQAEEAVAEWRAGGQARVFVVPYALSYAGYLPSLRATARSAGATGVTDLLSPHRLVTDLLVSRYEQAGRPLQRRTVHAA